MEPLLVGFIAFASVFKEVNGTIPRLSSSTFPAWAWTSPQLGPACQQLPPLGELLPSFSFERDGLLETHRAKDVVYQYCTAFLFWISKTICSHSRSFF